jgi:hypothetical protein
MHTRETFFAESLPWLIDAALTAIECDPQCDRSRVVVIGPRTEEFDRACPHPDDYPFEVELIPVDDGFSLHDLARHRYRSVHRDCLVSDVNICGSTCITLLAIPPGTAPLYDADTASRFGLSRESWQHFDHSATVWGSCFTQRGTVYAAVRRATAAVLLNADAPATLVSDHRHYDMWGVHEWPPVRGDNSPHPPGKKRDAALDRDFSFSEKVSLVQAIWLQTGPSDACILARRGFPRDNDYVLNSVLLHTTLYANATDTHARQAEVRRCQQVLYGALGLADADCLVPRWSTGHGFDINRPLDVTSPAYLLSKRMSWPYIPLRNICRAVVLHPDDPPRRLLAVRLQGHDSHYVRIGASELDDWTHAKYAQWTHDGEVSCVLLDCENIDMLSRVFLCDWFTSLCLQHSRVRLPVATIPLDTLLDFCIPWPTKDASKTIEAGAARTKILLESFDDMQYEIETIKRELKFYQQKLNPTSIDSTLAKCAGVAKQLFEISTRASQNQIGTEDSLSSIGLPSPAASKLRRIRSEQNEDSLLKNYLDLGSFLIKWNALLSLAALAQADPHAVTRVRTRLDKGQQSDYKWFTPSDGTWDKIYSYAIKEAAGLRGIGSSHAASLLRNVAPDGNHEYGRSANDFVKHRNKYAHPTGPTTKECVHEVSILVRSMIKSTPHTCEWYAFAYEGVSQLATVLEIHHRAFVGENTQHLPEIWRLPRDPATQDLVMSLTKGEVYLRPTVVFAPLPFSPWAIYQHQADDRGGLLLFNKWDGDKAEYSDLVTGATQTLDSYALRQALGLLA